MRVGEEPVPPLRSLEGDLHGPPIASVTMGAEPRASQRAEGFLVDSVGGSSSPLPPLTRFDSSYFAIAQGA